MFDHLTSEQWSGVVGIVAGSLAILWAVIDMVRSLRAEQLRFRRMLDDLRAPED